MTQLKVTQLPTVNVIILRQEDGKDFFISTKDSIIISPQSLAFILKFLVNNEFISPKLLEGVLEEYHMIREDTDVQR